MFGDRLKELREDSGMKQEDLGDILGVSRQTISGYENETSEPSISNLIKISDTFNVSLDYLLGRTKDKYNVNLLDKPSKEIIFKMIETLSKYKIVKK